LIYTQNSHLSQGGSFNLVEMAGIEPACKQCSVHTSTKCSLFFWFKGWGLKQTKSNSSRSF